MIGLLRTKKSKTPSAPTASTSAAGSSTQQWLPVKDVYNGFIHRQDGSIIAAIRVQPVNLNLLSENEKKRKIKALEEVLNGLDFSFQIISIARPVDLDAYIANLDVMRSKEENQIKARLLSEYMAQAAAMTVGGEALDRQFYILLDQPASKKKQQDEAVLIRRAAELVSSLTSADLTSHLCNDDELRELLFIFTNPNQAAFERAPLTHTILPPVFSGQEG